MTGEKPGNRRFWDAVLPGGVSTVPGSFLVIFGKKPIKIKPNPTLLLVPSTALTPCINPIILLYQVSSPNELFSHPLKLPEPLLGQHLLPNPRLQLVFLPLCILHSWAPILPLCQGSSSKPSLDQHPSSYCSCFCVLGAPSATPPQQTAFSTTFGLQFLCSPFSLLVLRRPLFLYTFKDSRRVTARLETASLRNCPEQVQRRTGL